MKEKALVVVDDADTHSIPIKAPKESLMIIEYFISLGVGYILYRLYQ